MAATYRELRNFTEMMRALGYPRLISIENFKTPNFRLLAEILVWLIQRYDPSSELPKAIDTEQDRVLFVKSVAQLVAVKANIKLNTKRLYQADNSAVKEVLRIASVLYTAVRNANLDELTAGRSASTAGLSFDLGFRVNDLKEARRLASEITQKGLHFSFLLLQSPNGQHPPFLASICISFNILQIWMEFSYIISKPTESLRARENVCNCLKEQGYTIYWAERWTSERRDRP